MRLNLQETDFNDEDDDATGFASFEPIRRNTDPVSGKHDMQRRAENGINRFRKNRQAKEQANDRVHRSEL